MRSSQWRCFYKKRNAFTLIELLVVIAIIAILAVVVILVLNPSQLLKESRDSARLSDAATIKSALGIYSEDVGGSMGSSSVIYVSIPDPLATSTAGDQCQGLGLSAIGSSTYQCESSTTYRLTNGTGWIPVNLKSISIGSPISAFPVDPINTSSSGYFYTYETSGTLYETTMAFESTKDLLTEASDGGQYTDLYEQGTNLALAPTDFYSSATTGPNNGFAYYRAITVTSTTSIASGTLANFPMLVSSTVTAWEPASLGGHIQNLCTAPNGGQEPCDLTFSASSACTSPLNYETESYTSSTGAVADWVSVPSLSAGTTIYACYGKSSVATDQSHPSATWSSNYMAVYHFPSSATLVLNDSTAGASTLANSGATASAGEMGGGASLGTSAAMTWTAGSSTFAKTPSTLSLWFSASLPERGCGYWSYNSPTLVAESDGYWALQITCGFNYPQYYAYLGSPQAWNGPTSLNVGWNQMTVISSSTGSAIYVNGILQGTSSNSWFNTGVPSSSQGLVFGYSGFAADSVNAIEDEIEFLNVQESPSWILTEYNNQSSPSTFYSIGSEL